MKTPYTDIKIRPGIDFVAGAEEPERFHITASKKNAEIITIDNFDYGTDTLHFGKHHATGVEMSWIDSDNDGEADDLQLVMGGQTVILTDLAAQFPSVSANRYEQDFETGTGGWRDSGDAWYGTATQVVSGTNGIVSASGDHHAVLEGDGSSAPYDTFLDQGGIAFEPFTASVKIYLDTSADGSGWADGEGFDYSVAANTIADTHLRDFVFHVTQDTSTGELYVAASNNTNFATREDLDTLAGSAIIAEDGWYTFEHRFYENASGDLAVDMVVLDETDAIIFSATRTNVADDIANVSGDPRYGWFTVIDVSGGIAVDDLALSYESDSYTPLPDVGDLFFA